MFFSVSGIEISPAIPLLVAFIVSFFTSMGGVSGAFFLLPFQVSVLGFSSPSVSPTNLVFNIVAIPSGVYRYIKEGRMAWPLAWVIILGTLPGILVGAVLRIRYLPDPKNFKLFVGLVLLYIGIRLLCDLRSKEGDIKAKTKKIEEKIERKGASHIFKVHQSVGTEQPSIKTIKLSLTRYTYEFCGEAFSCNTIVLLSLSLVVGVIGGAYGVGGGAIIAPFLIAVFGLPVYTIAGATLLGTFLTSIAGVVFYSIIAPVFSDAGFAIAPDWKLGALFGIGGFVGIYFGARVQKYFPAKAIKLILGSVLIFLSGTYIFNFFK